MRVLLFFGISACLFDYPVMAQQTADEKAILEVINQDHIAWAERDFDKWAAGWIHESYVTAFWGGYGQYNRAEGWDAVAASTQSFFNNTQPAAPPPLLQEAMILVRNGIATVRSDLLGHMYLHVLENEDGHWKLIQSAAVNKDAYDLHSMVQDLEGRWSLDPNSVKITNNPGMLRSMESDIDFDGLHIKMKSSIAWKNGNGKIIEAVEVFDIRPSASASDVQVNRSWNWMPGGGDLSSGHFQRNGKIFSGQLYSIGREWPYVDLVIDFSRDDRIKFLGRFLTQDGNERSQMQYELVKSR